MRTMEEVKKMVTVPSLYKFIRELEALPREDLKLLIEEATEEYNARSTPEYWTWEYKEKKGR